VDGPEGSSYFLTILPHGEKVLFAASFGAYLILGVKIDTVPLIII